MRVAAHVAGEVADVAPLLEGAQELERTEGATVPHPSGVFPGAQ